MRYAYFLALFTMFSMFVACGGESPELLADAYLPNADIEKADCLLKTEGVKFEYRPFSNGASCGFNKNFIVFNQTLSAVEPEALIYANIKTNREEMLRVGGSNDNGYFLLSFGTLLVRTGDTLHVSVVKETCKSKGIEIQITGL